MTVYCTQVHLLLNVGEHEDVEVTVDVEADMSYTAGRTYGPPEDCYPPNSECEVNRLTVAKCSVPELPDEQVVAAINSSGRAMGLIEDALWESFNTGLEDRY